MYYLTGIVCNRYFSSLFKIRGTKNRKDQSKKEIALQNFGGLFPILNKNGLIFF